MTKNDTNNYYEQRGIEGACMFRDERLLSPVIGARKEKE